MNKDKKFIVKEHLFRETYHQYALCDYLTPDLVLDHLSLKDLVLSAIGHLIPI